MGVGSENEDDASRFGSSSVTFGKICCVGTTPKSERYLGENGETASHKV